METNNKSGYTIICKSLYHTSKYDSNSLYELKLEKNNSIIIDVDWKIKNPYSCLNVELKEKGFFFLSIKEKAISSGQIDKYKDNSGKLSFIITAEAFISSEKVATKQIEIIFDNGKKRKAIACVLALCIGIPVAGGIAAGIAVPLVNKNKGGDEPKPEPTPTPIEIDLKGATTASIEYGNTVKEQYTCTYKDKEG